MNNQLKIVFAGTPQFAVPFLTALLAEPDWAVVAVLTQPDRPSGREQKLSPTPIKTIAVENNLAVLQPEKLKDNSEIVEQLKQFNYDYLVVVAYGLIIPPDILNLASYGNINVHPSLLPHHRGASPVQSAILSGDDKTGVTIMLMDEKMDHGPILAQENIALGDNETNESLHQKLADLGTTLLIKTIRDFTAGNIKPTEQDHQSATFCRPINKDEAKIDWQQNASQISRQIRAFYPWPVAWTTLDGQRLKIFPPISLYVPSYEGGAEKNPGEIFLLDNKLTITCGQGALILSRLQLAGKRELSAKEFINGNREIIGKILGD